MLARIREAILHRIAVKIESGALQPDRWPPRVALLLAKVAVTARPIGWYPGWRFATGDASADPVVRVRKCLWQYFAARHSQLSFVMRWYDGLKVRLYPGNDLSWTLFLGGCFEPNEFAVLDAVLECGMTFVDVGANDGLYTLFAARRVGPAGTVMAIEPSEREFERLNRNLRLNRFRNVRTFRLAASDRQGEATLSIAGYGHEGQNTLGAFIYDVGLLRKETVQLAPLDDLVRQEALKRVDVIKMDAEGAECSVLEGARATLQRDCPLLLMELSDAALRNQDSSGQAVVNFLKAFGYNTYIFDPGSGRPVRGELPPPEYPNIVAVHRSKPETVARWQR